MKNSKLVTDLAAWLESLKTTAKNDEQFSVEWFGPTKNDHFAIVAGWMSGFSDDYSDLLCISKSNPKYAMCVKIIENEGPYAYADFEILDMPMNEDGDVEDTCIVLEYNDDTEALAQFFAGELATMTENCLGQFIRRAYAS
jgi:hypothetical protein